MIGRSVAVLSAVGLAALAGLGVASLLVDPEGQGEREAAPDKAPALGSPSSPRLTGERRTAADAEAAAEDENEPASVLAYLNANLPSGWTGTRGFALNPLKAARLAEGSPGGIDGLVAYYLARDPPRAPVDIFAFTIVSSFFAHATHLDAPRRRALTTDILTRLESGGGELAAGQTLAALGWLSSLDHDRAALDRDAAASTIVGAANPLVRRQDLRVAVALARLELAPHLVLRVVDGRLQRASCQAVEQWAHLLRNPGVLDPLRTHGSPEADSIIERLEGCSGGAARQVALVLRLARGDSWSEVRRILLQLAARHSVSDLDYVFCVREALMHDGVTVIRDLRELLAARPMYIDRMYPLFHRSLVNVRYSELLDLLQSGSLYWDAEAGGLRQR